MRTGTLFGTCGPIQGVTRRQSTPSGRVGHFTRLLPYLVNLLILALYLVTLLPSLQ